jgi:hypothetical protein
MNRTLIALAALVIATPALAGNYVNGYTRKDGTYVAPHYRSAPDGNRFPAKTSAPAGESSPSASSPIPAASARLNATNRGARTGIGFTREKNTSGRRA